MTEHYEVTERLCKTEDGTRVVPENHPDARWLYAIPGQQVPLEEARTLGLVTAPDQKADEKADETPDETPDEKAQEPTPNKARGKRSNK
jgi:hypothetical protein